MSRNIIVAPTDAEAEERVYGEQASNRYYCTYMRKAIGARQAALDDQAAPGDDRRGMHPGSHHEECVIHGSPRTVLDKLVALRDRVGPFGTLLQDRPRLERPERGLGARGHAAAWRTR